MLLISQLLEKIDQEQLKLATAAVEVVLPYQDYISLASQFQGLAKAKEMINQSLEEQAEKEQA